jgi:hypothetical protein
MAAPSTGVIVANILNVKKIDIVTNGIRILLCLIPGIAKVRLVINKLVKEIVVLIPAKTTDNIKTS